MSDYCAYYMAKLINGKTYCRLRLEKNCGKDPVYNVVVGCS